MARTDPDRGVRPSLLDRLTDLEPRQAADPEVLRKESERRFRAAVQRDVAWLLNTRRTMVPVGAAYPQVLASVHEYGLPDTTGLAVGTHDGRQQLLDDLRDTIQRFEPRLTGVRVRLLDADQVRAPQLRFAVEATLRMDPNPELIVFDTVLEVASGAFAVEGDGTPRPPAPSPTR